MFLPHVLNSKCNNVIGEDGGVYSSEVVVLQEDDDELLDDELER